MYAVAFSGFQILKLGSWGFPVEGGGLDNEYLQLGNVRGDKERLNLLCPHPLPCLCPVPRPRSLPLPRPRTLPLPLAGVKVRGLRDLSEVRGEGTERGERIGEGRH